MMILTQGRPLNSESPGTESAAQKFFIGLTPRVPEQSQRFGIKAAVLLRESWNGIDSSILSACIKIFLVIIFPALKSKWPHRLAVQVVALSRLKHEFEPR